MVRIIVAVLAFAATVLTASIQDPGLREFGGPAHHLPSRSPSTIHVERRQAGELEKKFQAFQATLSNDQKAKGKASDDKTFEAMKSLTDDQRKKLGEFYELIDKGDKHNADEKFQVFEKTLTDDQKAKVKAAEDASAEAKATLNDGQKKALAEMAASKT
ncbi:hypothetical protein HIM_05625 [Hirsutella minnesotensis 3608]|uniref:Uncharacterized protein n=1 Tax=Hirsutella minnesotensis 3608 TaxID=1043627 RepID=A0A0F8A5D5_9HYPO|nr:hypothetical protein HIM_05625 [Hirsutella minnesotensis 3608]